ncbi:2853_t:CDS:2, partial [Gigaspora rosea]
TYCVPIQPDDCENLDPFESNKNNTTFTEYYEKVLRRCCDWDPEFAKSAQKKCAQWISPKDIALGGGIPCSSLTEIVGPTISAKRQSTIFVLRCRQYGLGGGTCYINTQRTFLRKGIVNIFLILLMEIAKYRFTYLFDDENPQYQENFQEFIIENNIRLLIIDPF